MVVSGWFRFLLARCTFIFRPDVKTRFNCVAHAELEASLKFDNLKERSRVQCDARLGTCATKQYSIMRLTIVGDQRNKRRH